MQNQFERRPKVQRRVVVTGLGMVTPLGLDAQTSWQNALKATSGIAAITRFDASLFDVKIAGEVKNFQSDLYIHKKEQKKMDLFIHYAIACAQMAIQDSGLSAEKLQTDRAGVFVGAGMGGLPEIENEHDTFRNRGPSRISPFFIPKVISNMAAGQISILTGAKGPNFCITSACASGSHAIGEAARYIRDGICDIMIAGGSESVVSHMAIGGFSSMRALSTRNSEPEKASRPFDKDRDGFVLGEGAGIFILEDYEFAKKRNAKIYAEISGYGSSSDAFHMTNPAPQGEGAARAMLMALKDAELANEKIDYVNAHGTSTPVGDQLESQAIETIFGSHAQKLCVSSTKSMTGHLLGAAGAVETGFCLLALQDQVVPPTINLDTPGENCRLDYVPHEARQKKLLHVMNNSFGFGGTNCSLVFSKI